MRRIRLTVEYDGGDFQGWQVQERGRSVQGELEDAIEKVTQTRARVIGAGRTDAGVHARGQVAHFDSETRLRPLELLRALNAVLPEDVAVAAAADAPPDFHARFSALEKRYVYRIWGRSVRSPLARRQTWHVRGALDLAAMERAAQVLRGEHDFAAFRGAPGGPPPGESTVRELAGLDLVRQGPELSIRAQGRSFLRYMVRNLVGTLVEVGQGRRSPEDVGAVLASRDRSRAGPTAPAHGLCLVGIRYPGAAEGDFSD